MPSLIPERPLLAAPGLAAPLGRAAAFYRFLAMKG